jgi:tRNA A-37 threonylcarbamoyl transferase component Bud32
VSKTVRNPPCIGRRLRDSETETARRLQPMLKVKDTLRATVHLSFDGRVFKAYHGPKAQERFENEVRVLKHLAARHCPFVPRLLEAHPDELRIVTTNCGARVEHLDEKRTQEMFAELEKFGVRHDDPDVRNITYRFADGRFCVIDFEFATILPEPQSHEEREGKSSSPPTA